ncbi:MAG: membrane protein insertase YidC [Bdellovibrionales bacterium]|nr:membrane protein insertase YidC [Bdellovibrionales bacterium]
MDKKTLIAITLSFLIFLGWQKLVIEPRYPKPAPAAVEALKADAKTDPKAAAKAAPKEASKAAQATAASQGFMPFGEQPKQSPVSKNVVLKSGPATVSNEEKLVSHWKLESYRKTRMKDSDPVDLSVLNANSFGDPKLSSQGEIAFDAKEYAYLNKVWGRVTQTGPNDATWTYEDAKVKLVRTWTVNPQNYFIQGKITAEFKADRPNFLFVSLEQTGGKDDEEAQDRNLFYWGKSLEKVAAAESMDLKDVEAPVKWIGVGSRYFMMALIPDAGAPEAKGLIQPLGPWKARTSLVFPMTSNKIEVPMKIFFGPKDLSVLRSVDATLDHTVDFGWFTVFAYPMLELMKFLNVYLKNWGLAIIVLTLLIKIVTYPLNYKSLKSAKEMQKIQPEINRLKERYGDNKEALNREMLTLMKTHGYNPAAGCLPILIQMPVFFALYRVLYSSIELYQAPFAFWIHDLSAKDPYYVTPVLLTAVMFVQQKLTPSTATDPMQAKMLQYMPVIFGFFMISLPSGLTLYMLVNALASIAQQAILNRKFANEGPRPAVITVK